MRAATVARVSTAGQAETGFSLPEQERSLGLLCDRTGLTRVEHLVDEGVSGRIADRPAIRRLIELAEAGAVEVVVFASLSRLGRENRLVQQHLHQFRRTLGLKVVFADFNADDSPTGRFLENVLGAQAELEWAVIRERMMKGKAEKARTKGIMPNGPFLFGYRIVSRAEAEAILEFRGRGGELIPIPAEAEVIRELYRRFAAGATLRALAVSLNEQGFPTRRGGPWRVNTIRELLANPAYRGVRYYGRKECRNTDELRPGGHPRVEYRPRAPEDWIEMPCPALVDEALWRTAERRIVENTAAHVGRTSELWLLRGVVFCGTCLGKRGQPLRCVGERCSRDPSKPGYLRRTYRCASQCRMDLPNCGARFPAADLERLARAALLRAQQPAVVRRRVRQQAAEGLREAARADQELPRLERELAGLEIEERKLLGLALEGFSGAALQERLRPLNARRAALRTQVERLRAAVAVQPDLEAVAREAEERAAGVRAALRNPNPAEAQALYQRYLRVTLRPGEPPIIVVRD